MQGLWQDCAQHIEEVIRFVGPRRCSSRNWGYDTVKYSIQVPVASVKLDDLRNANGLTNKTTCALTDIAVELHQRPDVKVVVFTAGGAYFCTGGAFAGTSAEDAAYAPRIQAGMTDEEGLGVVGNLALACLMYLLNTLPQYKVASIRGKNMGAGNSLIAAMDYVVAPSKASLSFREATRGLAACTSWQGIVAKLGVPRTRRLTLAADQLTAHEAKASGLVDEIVVDTTLEAAQRGSDDRAVAKAAEVAGLDESDVRQLKTTGPHGTRVQLLEIPAGARSCKALAGPVPDFAVAVEEVIEKCGRTGRPAPARLSRELWPHDSVRLARIGQHVAEITLANPKVGNRLDKAMLRGLLDALVELHRSVGRVRLVCVRAEGEYFCAGLDESLKADAAKLQQMLFLFHMLPMYVLGVVEGKVSGLGVALCCTFDALLAKRDVEFCFQGLDAQNGGELLAARTGSPLLQELCSAGATKTAEEAMDLSLVSHVFDGEQDLNAHMADFSAKVSECAPNAVAEAKGFLQQVGTVPMDLAMLHSMSRHIARRQMDPEFKDSIRSITVEGHRPFYNRHEFSKVLLPWQVKPQEDRLGPGRVY